MTTLPTDRHLSYQLQYRKCGKGNCRTCREGQGHGPYWYAVTSRVDGKQRCIYIGKKLPDGVGTDDVDSTGQTDVDLRGQQ